MAILTYTILRPDEKSTESEESAITQTSPLLARLPAELRNQVYRSVFISNHPFQIPFNPTNGQRNFLGRFLHPRDVRYRGFQKHRMPLQTCRQIHSEASKIFYSENQFCLNATTYDQELGGIVCSTLRFKPAAYELCKNIAKLQITLDIMDKHFELCEKARAQRRKGVEDMANEPLFKLLKDVKTLAAQLGADLAEKAAVSRGRVEVRYFSFADSPVRDHVVGYDINWGTETAELAEACAAFKAKLFEKLDGGVEGAVVSRY